MDDSLMMNSLTWDISDLARHLRQERLFVSSEQQHLQGLNEKVISGSSKLAQLAWVTAQQRDNLNRLVVARPDCTPAACLRKANTLDNTIFVDGYKVLGFQECLAYGEFLQTLRTSPELLASCLVAGDRLVPEMMHGIVHSIAAGLFGSSLLPEDMLLALRLLRHLTEIQLVPSEDPRRLLRQRSCAFARLYGEFHESLFSAKLFLTAALHQPIMQLLVEDEMFLDIDPDKATVRFPPEERLKKFGPEGSPEYNMRLQEYRNWTNSCLVAVTNRFVLNLRNNMHCFPNGVCWLIRQIAGLLSKSGNIEPKEVNAICTDLVFTYFICPAIVNPEPYGITDAPISYISRFNLIQVAKIVQMLAMTKYEDVDSKVSDLYDLFEKDCVSSLLDAILQGSAGGLEDVPVINDSSKLQGLSRSAALFTETELHNLAAFLQAVASDENESEDVKKQVAALLVQLPLGNTTVNGHSSTNAGLKPQPPTTPSTPRKGAGLLGKVSKARVARSSSSPASSTPGEGTEETVGGDDEGGEHGGQDVLVIPFTPNVGETIGLIAEQKILCMEEHSSCGESRVRVNLPDSRDERDGENVNVVERGESHEKRTRFSLSHDEGSIGNTSDNLEAVSEAASNHSVASSLELENDQNDNLSDMVSANVSGRGTPNISGRDTPSSQITEGEEGPGGVLRGSVGEPRQSLDFPPPPPNKQSRTDIDDKFGKFEIKKLLEGDETISMVSDTWSTDVLASDSETVEQSSERNFPTSAADSAVNQFTESTQLLDVSETASEAWSTDVLASDSERLTEVDTDDTGSVARSDDTARSEVEVEGRGEPEGGEDAPSSSAQSGVGMGFRPIREDPIGRASLLAPASPTRVDGGSHPAWNVTGRGGGKADYRRRTVEYVDNSANNPLHRGQIPGSQSTVEDTRLIHVIDKIDKPPDLKPAVVAASQASVSIVHIPGPLTLPALHNGPIAPTPPLPQNGVLDPAPVPTLPVNTVPLVHIQANHTSAQNDAVASHIHPHLPSTARHVGVGNPVNMETDLKHEVHGEEETDRDSVGDVIPSVVRLSSTSLASTSSSGSGSDPRPKTVTPTPDLPLAPTALVMNGHAMMADGEVPVAKTINLSQSTSSSTGAIPKSISFDKTAERGDKDLLDEDQKHKRGFFRNFKLPFKSRRVKTIRGSDEFGSRYEPSLSSGEGDVSHLRLRRGMSEDPRPTHNCNDTTEDILAKYRRKPSAGGDSTASEPGVDLKPPQLIGEVEDERLSMDPANIEASYAFIDAKRKLRMVLSTADLQHVPWVPESTSHARNNWMQKENELVSFLQLQLAEAINLQDRSLIAHLHETLRCIRLFDDTGCQKLFKSLEGDYQKRSPYIAYLVRCRQGLLSTLAHLERLIERLKCDRQVCSRFLVAVCVTMFLEKREQMLSNFTAEFQQLTLADEKTDLLDNFLHTLSLEMDRDPTWQAASNAQLEQAHTAVERAVISRVYTHALYPNGDGDVSRDQVLHEHMKKLSNVITPNHKDLRIPKMFHYECPWPSAQAEVSAMAAYKTPRDKLQCVFRCATTIMNLLSLACERGVPAADDFVPVLVYVLIKANPPSLLSTVQYVNSFYGSRLEGEEQYWWIQFCSAIEFIKTMDYSD